MTTRVPIRYGGTGANTAAGARQALDVLSTSGGTFTGSLNVGSDLTLSSVLTANTRGIFGNGFIDHANTKDIDVNTVVIGGIKDENGPAEVLLVNKSNGAVAYAEFIALNDSANQEQGWISIGVNSSNYNDPEFTLTGADDGYLLYEAPLGTSANGDLIIGTGSYGQNNRIVMAAGGFEPSDAQLIIAPAELKTAEIVNSSLNNNIAILTTAETHTFIANDLVVISSVGAPYDGTRTITAVTSNTFNVSITNANVASAVVSPAGSAVESLPFNKGTVELTAQLFVGENSKQTIEDADITLIQGHAIPLGIVVDNDGPGQTVMFNKSNGALSYSEFIAHNDTGNVEHGWISIGINSSGYDDPEFPITKADDGYILFEAPENTPGDGDLIIGTGAFGAKNRLIFAAEGFDEANAQMIITPNESVRISINTDSSSVNTGALQVVGGVGVQGSMYVQGNQTIQGDLIVNGSQIIQSIENLAAAGPISLLSDGNIANTWDQGLVGTYAISKSSATSDVEFKEIANNSAKIYTSNNHTFVVEDIVTLANVDVTFNGTHRISDVTANTFSFYKLANAVSKTAATGTATVDKATRYTGVVKRASDGAWRVFSNLGTRPAFNTNFADANLAYDSIIAGSGDFRGTLKLGSPNTATIVYTDANNRTLTIPTLGGDRTFAFLEQTQTFTAAQAFNNTITATKFIPTAGDATGNGLYLPSANKLAFSADGVERLSISASEMVVNDGSNDYDFRVESDGVSHMLFVDGGTNTVGIGTNIPAQTLHVQGGAALTGNVGIGTTNPTVRLDVRGSAIFNDDGADADFRVESDNNPNMLFIDGGTDQVVIGGNTPGLNATLTVYRFGNSGGNNAQITVDANADSGTGQAGLRLIAGSGTTNRATRIDFLNAVASTSVPRWTMINDYSQGGVNDFRLVDSSQNFVVTALQGGNIGIGTTSPGKKLTIFSGVSGTFISGTQDALRFHVDGYGDGARQSIEWFQDAGGGQVLGRFGLEWNNTADHMNFVWRDMYNAGLGSSEIMRLTGNGRLGIGTSSPLFKLDVSVSSTDGVNGTVANSYPVALFTNRSSGGGNRGLEIGAPTGSVVSPVYIKVYATSARFAILNNANTEQFTILNSGNVGIGTTNPVNKLQIDGDVFSSANVLSVAFHANSRGSPYTSISETSSGAMSVFAHNASAVTGSANVIKAQNTGYHSHFIRMYYDQGIAFHTSSATRTAGDILYDFGTPANVVSGTAERVRIDNGGNVGIGTSSVSNKLHVVASSATANADVINLDGGSTGFIGSNDLNTAYSLIFNACAYVQATGVVQRTGASITMAKEISWNEADTGGAGTKGALVFKTNSGTIQSPSLLERMRISSGGIVSKPNQPFVYMDTVANVTATGQVVVRYTNVFQSQGGLNSSYNTSNGRFTAPVAGIYSFSWNYLYQSVSATNMRFDDGFNLNGTFKFGPNRFEASQKTFGDGYVAIGNSVTVKLAAGDYFEVRTTNSQGTASFYADGNWGYLQIYYLG